MDFDELTLVRVVSGPSADDLATEDAVRLQDAHLKYVHQLWSEGLVLAAGPAGGDDTVRGLALLRTDVDTARALMSRDPSVIAGRFGVECLNWSVPSAMVISGEGAPPSSLAEARS